MRSQISACGRAWVRACGDSTIRVSSRAGEPEEATGWKRKQIEGKDLLLQAKSEGRKQNAKAEREENETVEQRERITDYRSVTRGLEGGRLSRASASRESSCGTDSAFVRQRGIKIARPALPLFSTPSRSTPSTPAHVTFQPFPALAGGLHPRPSPLLFPLPSRVPSAQPDPPLAAQRATPLSCSFRERPRNSRRCHSRSGIPVMSRYWIGSSGTTSRKTDLRFKPKRSRGALKFEDPRR